MIEYPKIETVYNRLSKRQVDVNQIRWSEFSLVKEWRAFEKINGTNVRIVWSRAGGRQFASRSVENIVQLTPELQAYLESVFSEDLFEAAFPKVKDEQVQIFGEGYGAHVDSSDGRYRKDPSIRLFDVYIGGWWLEPSNVIDIAGKFGLKTAPDLGKIYAIPQTVEQLKLLFFHNNGNSLVSADDGGDVTLVPEGIVARTVPMLFTRKGERLMWKLKFKDFA